MSVSIISSAFLYGFVMSSAQSGIEKIGIRLYGYPYPVDSHRSWSTVRKHLNNRISNCFRNVLWLNKQLWDTSQTFSARGHAFSSPSRTLKYEWNDSLKITIRNRLSLENTPPELEAILRKQMGFTNPKWQENERLGRWNKGTPEHLSFFEKTRTGRILLPRGYVRQLMLMCRRMNISYTLEDLRRTLPEVDFTFSGRLKPFQEVAAERMLSKEFGTLSAPTGSGKTVIALYMIAGRRQPALVVVHTRDLAFQWTQKIGEFLSIPEDSVGLIGGGEKRFGPEITVALVQSLYKCAEEAAPRIGSLVVDECRRAPSRTFTEAVSAFDARYMLGLTATPWRRDKLSRLIFWHLGDVHHEIEKSPLIKDGHILEADVVIRETAFSPFHDPVREYPKMLSELTADDDRNRMIAEDVAREAEKGVCLVLSDRKKHCETLHSLLRFKHHIQAELLTGDLTMAQRRTVIDRINQGAARAVVATGQLIGEGFDCRNLTTLFITTPVRFTGRILQYLGRILRPAPGKTRAKVYDYVDVKVGPLMAAARNRQWVYRSQNTAAKLEDSAPPS